MSETLEWRLKMGQISGRICAWADQNKLSHTALPGQPKCLKENCLKKYLTSYNFRLLSKIDDTFKEENFVQKC